MHKTLKDEPFQRYQPLDLLVGCQWGPAPGKVLSDVRKPWTSNSMMIRSMGGIAEEKTLQILNEY